MSSEVRNVLVKARSLIENRWCQNSHSDGYGGYCLQAAINVAAGEMVDHRGKLLYLTPSDLSIKKLAYDARSLVAEHLPEPYQSIAVFNDQPSTSRNDVCAVLDKAICAC